MRSLRNVLFTILGVALFASCSKSDIDHRHEKSTQKVKPKPAPVDKSTQKAKPTPPPLLINVPQIVGRTKDELTSILGQPTSCEKSKYGEKCFFTRNEMEVVFINRKSDWITINKTTGLKFSPQSIQQLGFPQSRPSFSSAHTIRWENINGIREVSLFPRGDRVFYVYVKAFTK